MSLGLFDVVGPIMHGPSSNHTGGATRIGYLTRCIMGGIAKDYVFMYHPIFMRMFTGHRTHIGMLAGCLGIREYEEECNNARRLADEQGISVSYRPIEDEEVDRNTMRILGHTDGVDWNINGISVGGGNVLISRINGVETAIDGNCSVYIYLIDNDEFAQQAHDHVVRTCNPVRISTGHTAQGELLVIETRTGGVLPNAPDALLGDHLILSRIIAPIVRFTDRTGNPPLFTSLAEFVTCCSNRTMAEAAMDYEVNRSGCSRADVMAMAFDIVDVIGKSMEQGLKGNNPLLGGYCSGSDGKMMDDWGKSGNSIVGSVFNDAIAGALAMAEVNACGGRIVAVPTAGSAGGLPGTLFAVAKRYNSSREQLAEAFLVAAAVGAVIGRSCSFSGSIGGCQAEVGVGAGMAAAGACYLAGANAETAIHAASLAIKNSLGLVCDPLAGPVEVPCIKRNAMGASVALMGAEMALAGIRSVVPPDEVIVALKDTQDRIPTELRGACIGGLAAAPIAKSLQDMWQKKLEANRALQ